MSWYPRSQIPANNYVVNFFQKIYLIILISITHATIFFLHLLFLNIDTNDRRQFTLPVGIIHPDILLLKDVHGILMDGHITF